VLASRKELVGVLCSLEVIDLGNFILAVVWLWLFWVVLGLLVLVCWGVSVPLG
jgi:hypothetical protein